MRLDAGLGGAGNAKGPQDLSPAERARQSGSRRYHVSEEQLVAASGYGMKMRRINQPDEIDQPIEVGCTYRHQGRATSNRVP